MMRIPNLIQSLVLSALVVVLSAGFLHSLQEASTPVASSLKDIKISFKLDPRLTRGLYMGDRWVSPPTYTAVREGRELTVVVRAEGLDAGGRRVSISPEWASADPEMVSVWPVQGTEVKIIVRRAGQSSLKVASHGISRELIIKATYENDVTKVEISPVQTFFSIELIIQEEVCDET